MGKLLRACLATLLFAGALSHAQGQAAAPVRLDKSICPVDTSAPPAGQRSPHGAYITRRTLLADETAASINFEVVLRLNNFADLQARVAQGQRISPQDMAAKYEPSTATYAQVTAWLIAQGFTITRTTKSHTAVFAHGSVSRLQNAMQLTFARVSNGSAEFTSAITAPSVPAALAPLLVGINGLQPHVQLHPHYRLHDNSLTSTNPPYTPAQIMQAYNGSSLYSSNITGAGQTIAIIIDTFPNNSDLTTFWSDCNINQSLSNFTFINVNSATLPAADDEVTLDTEWSSSIAYGAKIRVYAAGDLAFTDIDACYQQVYDDQTGNPSLAINQMSMSYGLGEYYEGNSQLQTDDQYFVMLAGAGVALFASSGDDGATPTSDGTGGTGSLTPEAPASDPNVTGVGGTSLTLTTSGSENTEVVWNNSSGATGGGVSQLFSQPSWQTGTGVPSGSMRCVPDIAAPADPNNGALFVFTSGTGRHRKQMTGEIGGTSWSSPTWAAFCALINQSRTNAGATPTGQLAPLVYKYIGTANFRDITSGNNEFQNTQGYSAGVGYDQCTGVGVPNVANLAAALTPVTQIAPAFTDGPATPTGEVGVAYSFTYTASGTPTATFTLAGGSTLPNGITLVSTGTLSGTPTQSGVFTGTVTASNGVSPSATQAYTLTINQPPAFTDGPPTSTTTVNTAYTFSYTASGFPAPTFSVTSGSLPSGLSLSSTGSITGTTTLAGSYTGTVTASNNISPDATQAFTIAVDQAPAFTSAPVNATVDNISSASFTLTTSGYPAASFTVTSGSLPAGLTLSTNGVISGIPTQEGTFTGVITASNGVGTAATQNFTIVVVLATDTPALPPAALVLLAAALMLAAARFLPSRVT
jgi:kumamolisin